MIPPPLTRAELAQALRDAADVARGDRGHDLLTALYVLVSDHRPDLHDPAAKYQMADAVNAITLPPGIGFTGPATAAIRWCREHDKTLAALFLEAADRVEAHPQGQATTTNPPEAA